ncbi:MAG: Gfo/Idh/MocA family oxidoreductase [Bacteroidota bacterium]
MNRRDFIKSSAGATAGASLIYSPYSIARSQQNKKYTTALIGSGWWGMNILREAIAADRAKVVALCDVDQRQLDQAMEETGKLTSDKPKRYADYRELLATEKPEVVIVATPDHWHPLQTIAAVEAGAHVYVEKPIGHTINEGKAMMRAARANNRMVQVGTHRRVSPHNISGMEFLKSGRAGKIGMVRAFVHYPGGPGEPTPDSEPPTGLDWDMWCGPAALVPYNERIHPKGFRQFLEFANGQIGDWGIHWLDQILWWTEEKAPKSVHSVAARHIREDNTTAPDTQVVNYEFEDFTAVWEHRQYAANQAEKHNIGCYFYGTEGTFHMGWLDGWTFYPSKKGREIIHVEPQLRDPDKQNIKELWADFLSSIETGNLPVCDIEVGHRSTNMSLLGMLSHKLGRSVAWDADQEIVPNDTEANAMLEREYRGEWQYPKIV